MAIASYADKRNDYFTVSSQFLKPELYKAIVYKLKVGRTPLGKIDLS